MVTKSAEPKVKNGLLPTPPMPKGLSKAQLTDNARQVLMKRYVRRGDDGKPAENVEEMFWRVAYHVAKVEEQWGADVQKRTVEYYHLLSSKKFFPNSPTFTGAGTPLGQLAACFTGGMRVTTDQGIKQISQLQVGDRVLTHKGRYRPVIELFQRAYDGEVLNIKVKLIGTTMEMTPEHPVLTEKGWVKAGELKVGSKVAIGSAKGTWAVPTFDLVVSQYADELELQTSEDSVRVRRPSNYQNSGRQTEWVNRFVELTPDLARLCGYYISEGTIGPDERYVRFTFAKDEIEYHQDVIGLVENIFGARVNQSDSSIGNWTNINVYSRPVVAWFRDHFWMGSSKKRLPVWLQYAEREIQEAFLVGVMRGDGMYFEKTYVTASRPSPKLFRSLRLTLSNPGLIQQIWQMCLRLGYDAAIRSVDTTYVTPNASDTAQIGMPPLQSRDLVKKAFGVILPEPDMRYVRNKVTRDDDHVYFEVDSIESQYFNGVVYNCEVDEDHSYITEGVIVHNCFVLPITDDMGRDSAGIFQTLRDAALIQQTGGGNGFSFSRLRPHGSMVLTSAGQATGPVGFLKVYDHAFGEIAQGGTRRGANMAVLRVDHPDVEDFIACKINENQITNFNISVGITDTFMLAVKEDKEWALRFPDLKEMKQKGFSGTLEQAEAAGITINTYKTISARELFNKIVKQAHHNGEPGMLFLDAANRGNPVPHLYPLEATNPCVTGDTLIYTDQGLRRADELAIDGQEINITSDARFGTDTFLPATHVFQTGTKPVYRLTTREGYELRLTEDHRVMTSRGWAEAGKLQSGDRIHILNRKGGFGEQGTLEEGRVLGWLVGDGTVNVVRAVLSFFGDEKQELAPAFAEMVTNLVEKPGQHRAYPVGVINVDGRDEARVASDRLRDWVAQYGITENRKHFVPSAVYVGSESIQRGFLQALFTADGQVNDGGEKGCSVRLSSSHITLLKDTQRLLLNFGIASRIYENRRLGGLRPMPDGKGGLKDYFHLPQHDLAVSKTNLIRFANEIGFLTEAKQTKLADYLSRMIRGPYEEPFLATVHAIEPDGVEPVYDLHQPDTHSFIANGLVVHNCGEQWLGPYENCCLGSVNLNEHCGPSHKEGRGSVDWESLRQSVVASTRFLDDVVEANAYVPAVPQLKEAAYRARRIGLGIMGLADLMYHVGVRYGSKEGQEFGAQIMEFVRYHAMKTSVELAEERGPFPAIEGSIYDMDDMKWKAPKSLMDYQNNWGMPEVKWDAVLSGIKNHGIRNAAQTTVAPTGTIATVAGCEGYGCEPVFALAYIRHVNDNGKDLKLTYASPRFDEALKKLGLGEEKRQEIVERVMNDGTCQNIAELPQSVRDTFVVSADISAEEHVLMQGALQAFVDNSLSKTVNFPENATEDDVAKAYMMAWELGCKGITVYVTGSRDIVVLETKATADKKTPSFDTSEKNARSTQPTPQTALEAAPAQPDMWHGTKKPRPRTLTGRTFNIETPVGKAFITINENGGEQPFEAFINTAKAGSEIAAVSEAIGRLISYILRMASPVAPMDRMREVVRQLIGIGGGRSLGFGINRVRSLPDGIGQVLDMYLREKDGLVSDDEKPNGNGHHAEAPAPHTMKIGDLCPECGEAAVVNEEGCRKCYACGFSEC